MNAIRRLLGSIFCLPLLVVPALGQFYQPMVIDPSLLKFLPEDGSFTAAVEINSRIPTYRWPVRMTVMNGMTRLEMDVSKMEQGGVDPAIREYYDNMRRAGSAESVTVFNPEKKSVFTILPRLKAYTEQPIPADALAELKRRPKAKKAELGTEEGGGRQCIKTKLTFDKGVMDIWRTWETPEAIIWTAKDAPHTLVRIDVIDSVGHTNSSLLFTAVDPKRPATTSFLPPRDFAKCSQESLMKRIMEKWPKQK